MGKKRMEPERSKDCNGSSSPSREFRQGFSGLCFLVLDLQFTYMVTSPRYGQEKFIKKLEIIVSKKSKAKLNLDCGWYSEQELYDVLNWAEKLF